MASAPAATVEPAWLTERRRKGASLASELSLPTQKDKGWEFTDLTGLDLGSYAAGEGRVEGIEAAVDGADGPPVVMSLREAAERLGDVVEQHFGSLVPTDDPFVARNEANWRSGVLVYVPRGQRLLEPLRLSVYQDEAGAGLDWRALIVLEEGAEAEVWERYVSDGEESEGLFNGVVELSVGPGASLRYVCEQELSKRSWVFATAASGAGARRLIGMGGSGLRLRARQGADGDEAGRPRLLGQGDRSLRRRRRSAPGLRHHPGTRRGAHHIRPRVPRRPLRPRDRRLAGHDPRRSRRSADGCIPGVPQPAALQAGARRRDPGARDQANDVRCTHAAAVAQVDPEHLYYLRAHGLPEPRAKRLIIDGFLQELAERTTEGPLRDALSAALDRRLGEILPEA